MNTRTLVRCFVVSLVIAIIVPIFDFDVVAFIGPDGNPIMSGVQLEPSGGTPLPPTRQLFGIEKYRYMSGGGWVWVLYLKSSLMYFLISFVAGFSVSVWNARQRRL